jgi:hypothetical protein
MCLGRSQVLFAFVVCIVTVIRLIIVANVVQKNIHHELRMLD